MKTLKCGVIGAGIMGKQHLKASAQFPYAEPVAVCDTNEERAKEVAHEFKVNYYYDYDEMLAKEDMDVIHVTTPDFAHRDPVIRSIQSGRHVLVEKPLATTMDDAKAISEAVRSSKAKFMVNFSNRWNPPHHSTKKAIMNGELGEIKHAYARLSNTTYVPTKMLSWSSKSSPTMFLLPHVIDLVRWFLDSEADTVYAVKTEGVLKAMGINTHDTMTAVIKFKNNAVGCFETSWILPESLPYMVDHYLKLIGSKGTIMEDLRDRGLQKYTEKGEYIHSADTIYGYGRGFAYDSIYHFLECVIQDKEPISNINDGLMNTAILCAIMDSSESGGCVKVC